MDLQARLLLTPRTSTAQALELSQHSVALRTLRWDKLESGIILYMLGCPHTQPRLGHIAFVNNALISSMPIRTLIVMGTNSGMPPRTPFSHLQSVEVTIWQVISKTVDWWRVNQVHGMSLPESFRSLNKVLTLLATSV